MKNQDRNQTLLEMLFEGKNKAYGAYHLRTNYGKHLGKAFVIGTTSILFIFLSSFYVFKSNHKPDTGQQYYPTHELIDYEELIDIPDPIEPEKPLQQQDKKVATVKIWEEVEPVAETNKEDTIVDFEKIKNRVIASFTQEGIESVEMIAPPVLPTIGEKVGTIAPPTPPKKTDNKVFERVERQPTFAGGDIEMYKFLGKNLRYPVAASRAGTQGIVFVSFIVERDGSISQAKVLKGIGMGCNEEALRVIKKMPKWEPGQQNGQNVRVRFTIPIKFKIS